MRYYDSVGLAEGAFIGAAVTSGVGLFLSATLCRAVSDELVRSFEPLPSGLDEYLQTPLNPRPGDYPWEPKPEDKLISIRISDDFWLHHLLRTRSGIYRPRQAMDGDFMIEIVDRAYVFVGPSGHDPAPLCRIKEWERGEDQAYVQSLAAELPGRYGTPAADKRLREIEAEFENARRNAVGTLRINFSLAIRNAFDAIHEHRLAKGSKFDWSASAKPTPGRYDGCTPDGYPLDPEHPWNKQLPPAERAKRLAEIEAYIAQLDAEREGRQP
ncbi:MAG TPA: hypothetical protein VHL31_00745 [Geminicoccus sp.]|uniref:hypothetical protein n=1 Tax=Geminicoccus sp. TaxID=2024832 RepID=UPI002E33E6F5|nr:hypothetical protein [Geminicoccus sp.]HEX2524818.1 hypothetical protein [Geminicoccus sp.]